MKKFLFIDLDDTLFQTLAKCHPADDLVAAAFLRDGSANSFSTPRQRAFLAMAQRETTLIPTTARDLDAFGRVAINFHSWAIVNFGGLIKKPDGHLDAHWQGIMAAQMAQARPGLVEIIGRIDAFCNQQSLPNRGRMISDAGIEFFALLKDPDKNLARLQIIDDAVITPWLMGDGRDYVLHKNGNNLALLPRSLDKSHAVAYVSDLLRAEHGEILTLGMGDSISDAAFLALCDFAITPKACQLAQATARALTATCAPEDKTYAPEGAN